LLSAVKQWREENDQPAPVKESRDATEAGPPAPNLPTADAGAWRTRLVQQLAEGRDTGEVLRSEGQEFLRQEANHRLALNKFLYVVYACARVLRADEGQRIRFCADPVWANARAKPRHDLPDEMLRFAIRFCLKGAPKSVNDKSSKYTRALLSAWEARKTPAEMLIDLEEHGIEALSRGLPMKVIGEKPTADREDQSSGTSDELDGKVAHRGKVLDGEVLATGCSIKRRQAVRFGGSKSSPTREGILERGRDKRGRLWLRCEVRKLK